jgi:nucleotide-binding universal stress UspA family protein
MFRKVLVGVDGHDGGRDAVALAKGLLAEDGSLTLVHVYPFLTPTAVRGYDEHEAAEIVRARELLQTARKEAGIHAQLRWTGAHSAARGLHELAETVGADLLVVGSTRRGLLGRVLIGDDTREALNWASCAVAIAPAGYAGEAKPIRTIGVGYDGSPDSVHAVAVARALAAEFDAHLAGMEVIWWPAYRFAGPAAADATRVADLVEEARNHVAELGDVEPHGAYGRPPEELAQWSDSLDLLVVGSRSWGPVARLVHGSTSKELARRARCPLLVLTRTAGEASPSDGELRDVEPAARHVHAGGR